jgi:hypothetical protein
MNMVLFQGTPQEKLWDSSFSGIFHCQGLDFASPFSPMIFATPTALSLGVARNLSSATILRQRVAPLVCHVLRGEVGSMLMRQR